MAELSALPPSTGIVVLDMAILAESNLGQVAEPYGYRYVVTVEADSAVRGGRAVRGAPSTTMCGDGCRIRLTKPPAVG